MYVGNVLVAGAQGGIGAAVCRAVEAVGGQAYGVDRAGIDITEPGGAETAVSAAFRELGDLDGVVHAVGGSGRALGDGPVTACTDEAWAHVHRVNHESVFRLLRAAIPVLATRGGGSIVAIGSALASTLDDDFMTIAYASAKAALTPLVRSAAYTAAESGVRINLVSPGLVETPMAERALRDPVIVERLPTLQRLGGHPSSADEIAMVVRWLLSDEASGITGAVVPADRGWTLR